MKRQFKLKLQDRFNFIVTFLRSIVLATMLGTVFLKLQPTTTDAFTRGSLIFMSFVLNCFEAFSEIAGTMLGRDITNKHKAYAFHRPSALSIAQLAVDQVFVVPRLLIFSIIIYFIAGLAQNAGAFFSFFLFSFTSNVAITIFMRIVGGVSPDFDYATKTCVIVITLFFFTTGYLIQYPNEKVWLRWIQIGRAHV